MAAAVGVGVTFWRKLTAMRIGSYNVENLFDRPKAMSGDLKKITAQGNPILDAHARLNTLIDEPIYTPAIKDEMVALLGELDLVTSDMGEYVLLRRVRGKFVKRTKVGTKTTVEVVVDGRDDWIGWVDLKRVRVNALATEHTARVIKDVAADVLGVIEAESRIALKHFTDAGILDARKKPRYPGIMVIDGNDDRGIDVGIMTRPGYSIVEIRSHVDDLYEAKNPVTGKKRLASVFSRDCVEYTVALPSGRRLIVMVNHFKSKGYGPPAVSSALRKVQAARAAEIYRGIRDRGDDLVALVGDLNDTPDSDPLSPLLDGTDLKDISEHPAFTADPKRPGTYGNGTKSGKIDYVLLSPALFDLVTGGGMFRKGVWGGKNGDLFEHYDTMTKEAHAGSDHAAIYADVDLA